VKNKTFFLPFILLINDSPIPWIPYPPALFLEMILIKNQCAVKILKML